MAKRRNDYLDVDAFVEEIEADEALELLPNVEVCPKCGSDTWQQLFYSKKTGKPNRCNECKSVSVN